MVRAPWTLRGLGQALTAGSTTPSQLALDAFACAAASTNHNTYLWQDAAWTHSEAARAESMPAVQRGALWGMPVSVKDCFDLAGAATSCGVRFYRDLHGVAAKDSWLVEQLRGAGAMCVGKTHLHPLAYGITGENAEFGDCVQPGDQGALTGGSSSGAAASVLEGSAVAAIGTDTGGSIRVPAALCGLVGYRATLGRGNWSGAAHLAQSFDTMGWLFRDLEDAPLLAVPFAPRQTLEPRRPTRFAVIDDRFLHDCDPKIVAGLHALGAECEGLGLSGARFSADPWSVAMDIFAPIQAWEAARIHAGYFSNFEPAIRERLEWGARITDAEIDELRERHAAFRAQVDALLAEHELLLLPASPVARLAAGADHSRTRARLLRYTTPFSLAGVPVVTVPGYAGGIQVAAARNTDESLLALAADIGARRRVAALSA